MILTVTANPAVDAAYFVEEFNMGEVHRPIKTVMTAGGKGLNVSKVAVTLGESVTAMGFLGGANGAFIKSEAERLGIGCAFTEITGETRRNIDIVDRDGRVGELLEAGPMISTEEKESFLSRYDEEVEKCDVVCISGSLPKGLDGDFYRELIKRAKHNKKRVIADSSGKNLEEVIKESPFMVKPNKDEMTMLFGEKDLKDVLNELYSLGVEIPFVTLGGGGAALFDGKEYYRFTVPRLEVKNTVGSGDSTIGGIATGLCRGMTVCDAVKLGMAAGMANTQFEESGRVSRELVERFYGEIKISQSI